MNPRSFLLTIVACLFLCCSAAKNAVANTSTNVPVDDIVYHYIDKLVAAGFYDSVIYGQRPFSRNEIGRIIASALDKEDELESNTYISSILDMLAEDYREELISIGALEGTEPTIQVHGLDKATISFNELKSPTRIVPPNNGLGIINATTNPLVENRGGRHYVDGSQFYLETYHRAKLSRYFALMVHPRFEILGPRRGEDRADVTLQNLYAKFGIREFELEVGRDSLVWGQGLYGGLLISNNARPLDMIKVSNAHPVKIPVLGWFKGTLFVANLGPEQEFPYSYFAGLKLSLKPFSFLEIGLSQGVIMGGNGSPNLTFKDGVLEFFGFRAGIGLGTDTDVQGNPPNLSNRIMGLDLRITIPQFRCTQVYYEMFTEACCGVFDKLYSYSAGIYIPRVLSNGQLGLRLEYKHIAPIFYRHSTHTSGWTLNRLIMGDHLGPAGDAAYAHINYDVNPHLAFGLVLAFERRGSDGYGSHGTAESTYVIEYRPTEYRYRTVLSNHYKWNNIVEIDTRLGYERVETFNFTPNNSLNNFLVGVGLTLKLDNYFKVSSR